jgi:hypothetical protein
MKSNPVFFQRVLLNESASGQTGGGQRTIRPGKVGDKLGQRAVLVTGGNLGSLEQT